MLKKTEKKASTRKSNMLTQVARMGKKKMRYKLFIFFLLCIRNLSKSTALQADQEVKSTSFINDDRLGSGFLSVHTTVFMSKTDYSKQKNTKEKKQSM